MQITNQSVLITGASRGLGRALALAFSREGARIILAARPSIELDRTVEEIREGGGTAYAVPTDVAEKSAIYPLAGQAAELVGPVDLLVNNASTLGVTPLRPLLDTECEDLERTIQTNLIGPFRLTKAVLGNMLLRGGGTVVNISSDAAVSAYAEWGAYSVTKAALDHLTRVWAAELEGFPVRFLSVDPGEMDTVMHALALPRADRSALTSPEHVAETIVQMVKSPERWGSGSRLLASEWTPA